MTVIRVCGMALIGLTAACQGGAATSDSDDFPVRFIVANALIAPVTISIDGTTSAILTSGKEVGLTVSSKAQWLTWTTAKPTAANGVPIPDDIGEVRIPISGINGALEIRNVIADQTYITARIFNVTKSQVSIGVYDGSSLACAGVLPAASDSVTGVVQIGYYRLQPATELRAYRDPSCTGAHVSWPPSHLATFAAKSGLLTLSLTAAP